MDGTDAFKRTGPGAGSNPFADRSYSDQFVRSATQPLGRRMTRPLELTPEVLLQQIGAAEEQVQLCRTILDRFAPRVRLLKTASEQARKPVAAPQPEAKKGLKPLGLKKPAAPSASPSAGDKALVDKLARRLAESQDLARRTAIALHQFDEASKSVAEAHAKLSQARNVEPAHGWGILEGLEISKLQGRVYPICNFYEVFKDDEAFWQLFPPPNQLPGPAGPNKTGRLFGGN